MKRIIILVGIGVLLSHARCTSTHGEEAGENGHQTEFLVSSPVKIDTSITKQYVCQIHSIQHIELRAQERGILEKIFVDEGQYVKEGQLMFQIMPKIYAAEVQKAQAEAEVAEIEYRNTKALADSNVVSQNELAMAKAKLDKALAELELAKVHLGFTEIRAPFDGIMNRFHVREGSLLEEGELLTELSDNSQMWVYFNVPEAEYLEYKSNANNDSAVNVRLLMANNEIFEFPGKVTTIEADFNNETGNIAFRATFPNPNGLLRHGETGNLLMEMPLKDAMLIPQKTTYEILDKKYVFVVDKDNVVRSRNITIGEEMPHLYVVKDGLEEGDNILLEGLRKVKEKDQIAFHYVKPDSAIRNLELYAE